MSYASCESYEVQEEPTAFQTWAQENGYDHDDMSNSERDNMLFQWRMFGKKEMAKRATSKKG